MSHQLTVELSDAAFDALERQARAEATSAAELAASLIEWLVADAPPLTEEEREAARMRLEKHFGALALNHPNGADNESIDADLARVYDNQV